MRNTDRARRRLMEVDRIYGGDHEFDGNDPKRTWVEAPSRITSDAAGPSAAIIAASGKYWDMLEAKI